MKIKTISVTFEAKRNLGDYNSIHVGSTIWADVEEGEPVESVYDQLWDIVKSECRENAAKKEHPVSIPATKTELRFAGKPVDVIGPIEEAGLDPRTGMPFGDK